MEYIFELLSISELPGERTLKLKFPKKKVMNNLVRSRNLLNIYCCYKYTNIIPKHIKFLTCVRSCTLFVEVINPYSSSK